MWVRCTAIGAEIHLRMNCQFRVFTGQGVRRGGIMPEVSWTSDQREGGVSGLVELFWKSFVFGIKIHPGTVAVPDNHRTSGPEGGAVRCSVC